MKFLIKIDCPQGCLYLTPGDAIATIAQWYSIEHALVLKAMALCELPLALMSVSATPYYYDSKDSAHTQVQQAGKELQVIKAWATSTSSDLFAFIDMCRLSDVQPYSIPACIEAVDVPEGYTPSPQGEARWHVTTYYEDQGYLFLEDTRDGVCSWVRNSTEGTAWSCPTEEEALARAKMVTRTESLYAYPRFCLFV